MRLHLRCVSQHRSLGWSIRGAIPGCCVGLASGGCCASQIYGVASGRAGGARGRPGTRWCRRLAGRWWWRGDWGCVWAPLKDAAGAWLGGGHREASMFLSRASCWQGAASMGCARGRNTFSHHQLGLGSGGVREDVVGLDELAGRQAGIASSGIARRRRQDTVHRGELCGLGAAEQSTYNMAATWS